jgi:hypothetical protein
MEQLAKFDSLWLMFRISHNTLLHCAARDGGYEICRMLIVMRSDVNSKGSK